MSLENCFGKITGKFPLLSRPPFWPTRPNSSLARAPSLLAWAGLARQQLQRLPLPLCSMTGGGVYHPCPPATARMQRLWQGWNCRLPLLSLPHDLPAPWPLFRSAWTPLPPLSRSLSLPCVRPSTTKTAAGTTMIHRTLPHRTKPLLLPFFTVVSAPPCPLPSRPSPMRNGALSALPSLANGLHGHRPWRGPCKPFPGCAMAHASLPCSPLSPCRRPWRRRRIPCPL